MHDAAYSAMAYTDKPRDYFSAVRRDFLDRMPPNDQARILEIGCGDGATGHAAKAEGKCGYYVGIELDPQAADDARNALDAVHLANVERFDLALLEGPFDHIILSEVLEHLVEPWELVRKLHGLMRPGGFIFASSPNIANHKIIRALLKGQFDYTESGAMDRTHLRWFTPSSFAEIFEEAGFRTVELSPVVPATWKWRLVHAVTLGKFRHLSSSQTRYVGRIEARGD